jgi:3-oxoacyl-[acyl-carrier protein] reductase
MNAPSSPVAVVTGAARGIGAATAVRLAADGHVVVALDLDADACADVVARIAKEGGTAVAAGADVADERAVESTVAWVAEEIGPPLVLVNNAGVLRDNLLHKMSSDDWDTVMGVHLRGSFLMSRATQKHMVPAKWGRIVNISSTSALGNRGQANYSAAKAGLQGLTRTLAVELGRFGVTVNAVAPGFVETDMTAATAARLGVEFDEFITQRAASIPVGRTGVPEDIAAAVAFFVRPDAGYVSGQVLYAAGGPRG